ncbi:MAG: AAA family ATPase [Magnetococcales bacterium]|nr:AAA family ATPase [Magnetococcales bacterium]
MSYNLDVTNFMSIKKARIEFGKGLTLLVGGNGSGKTSILRAAAACMCEDAIIPVTGGDGRALVQKGRSVEMVGTSGKKAEAVLRLGDNESVVLWPSNKRAADGLQMLAGPIQTGMADWMAMPVNTRRSMLADLLAGAGVSVVPTKADLRDALARVGFHGEEADKLCSFSSMDAALSFVEREMADDKGEWRACTGETWGEVKAENWIPAGFNPAWVGSQLDKEIRRLQAEINDGIGRMAVGNDVIARLRAIASQEMMDIGHAIEVIGKIEEYIEALESSSILIPDDIMREIEAAQADVDCVKAAIEVARGRIKPPIQMKKDVSFPCPVCSSGLVSDAASGVVLANVEEIARIRQYNEEAKAHNTNIAEENGKAKADLDGLADALDSAMGRMRMAMASRDKFFNEEKKKRDEQLFSAKRMMEKAKTELRAMETQNAKIVQAREELAAIEADTSKTVTKEHIDELRKQLDAVTKSLQMLVTKLRADFLHARIKQWAKAKDILAPSGLRSEKLCDAMGYVQSHIETICAIAKWPAIAIDDDLDLSIGGYPHYLLSPGFKLRCQYVMQFLFSMLSGKPPVLLDEFGVLDSAGRVGVVDVVDKVGLTALAACKESKAFASSVSTNGMVRAVYWVYGGGVDLIGRVVGE